MALQLMTRDHRKDKIKRYTLKCSHVTCAARLLQYEV